MSDLRLNQILVLDDDADVRGSMKALLEAERYKVSVAKNSAEALHILSNELINTVFCDLRLDGEHGIEFIEKAKKVSPEVDIVLMTAFGTLDIATQAIRAGASDYIPKPFRGDALLLVLAKLEEHRRLLAENEYLKEALDQKLSFNNIVSQSHQMQEIFETIRRLSNFNTTVLLTGESGTGKELIARAIHHNSPRRGKAFVAVNCGAIPETLMESELFGHRKGAFTDASRDKRGLFEEASGGTLFLDEIAEMPTHLQVKLLRVLQEKSIRRVGDEQQLPVDVRIVAATLKDLTSDVDSGVFREDLFYRLNVVSIHVPPLRERREDISLLTDHFIKKHGKRLGLTSKKFTPAALELLLENDWRGNVRELENCVERALVLATGEELGVEVLPDAVKNPVGKLEKSESLHDMQDVSLKLHTRRMEIALIQEALRRCNGNRTHAAKLLDISHRALLYKLKDYGLGRNATPETSDQTQNDGNEE